MLPPAIALPVVHDQVAIAQETRHAEIERRLVHLARKHDAAIAERTIGNGDRLIRQPVIDDFMADQDAKRVGPGLAIKLDRDDRRLRLQPVAGNGDGIEFRVIDRRDAVLIRATLQHFAAKEEFIGIARMAEIGLPAAAAPLLDPLRRIERSWRRFATLLGIRIANRQGECQRQQRQPLPARRRASGHS